MANLAIAAVGAYLGYGTVIGASGGWLIGSIIGNMLFPPEGPSYEGPRMSDLTVTSSAYGSFINRGWGTQRVNGNIIWSSGIKEVKKTESAGGKGGGGGEYTTYEYFASFAVALCEGPVQTITRVWADGKLMSDDSTSRYKSDDTPVDGEQEYYTHADGDTGKTIKDGVVFRIYTGSETQKPDPLIEADKGIGKVPAHRGICYLVFDNLPLADYGNRIPNITAEVTKASPRKDVQIVGNTEDSYTAYQVMFNRDANVLVNWDGTYLTTIDPITMDVVSKVDIATLGLYRTSSGYNDAYFGDHPVMDKNGSIFCWNWWTGNDTYLSMLNRNTYKQISMYKYNHFSFAWSAYGDAWAFALGGPGDPVYVISRTFNDGYTVATVMVPNEVLHYDIPSHLDKLIKRAVYGMYGKPQPFSSGKVILAACKGSSSSGVAPSVIMVGGKRNSLENSGPTDTLEIATLGIQVVASFDANLQTDDYDISVSDEKLSFVVGELITELIGTGHYYSFTQEIISVPGTDDLIWGVEATNGDNYLIRFNRVTNQVIYQKNIGSILARMINKEVTNQNKIYLESNVYGGVYEFDVTSQELLYVHDWDIHDGPVNATDQDMVYDYNSNSVIYSDRLNQNYLRKAVLKKYSTDGVPLSDIVTYICQDVGINPSDIDVSELSDILVHGYMQSRLMSAREMLEPLARFYMFDAIESDYKLKFKLRGGESTRTLTKDDIIGTGDNEDFILETVAQEVELPRTLNITYIDKDIDYQQNSQHASRSVSATNTRSVANFSIGLVTDATTAKQAAKKALHTAWYERSSYKLKANWKHIDLDPSDVFDVIIDEINYKMRALSLNVGADLQIELGAVSENAATYLSNVQADTGSGVPNQIIAGGFYSEYFLLPTPLLRDQDNEGRNISKIYATVTPLTGFSSSSLYVSRDGESYSREEVFTEGSSWGSVVSTLPDVGDDWNIVDTVTNIVIKPTIDNNDILSITYEQMMNGANALAIVKTNNNVEVLQFQTAVDNGNGTYTISNILRGRRGTEVFANGYMGSETFIVLSPSSMVDVNLALSSIGNTRYFRNVPTGKYFGDVPDKTLVNPGNDLKPYAPGAIKASWNGSDIDITWKRRTRFGGEWLDYTGEVTLAEDSEQYEIDFIDSAGDVMYTATGITTQSYTLTQASILANLKDVVSVTNPKANDGVSGWVYTAGFTTTDDTESYDGPYFSMAATAAAACEANQDVLIDAQLLSYVDSGSVTAELSWKQKTADVDPLDTGYMEIEALDGSMVSLGVQSEAASYHDTWVDRLVTYNLPSGTRYVRIAMHGQRVNGSNVNVYFDNIKLTLSAPVVNELRMDIYQISAQVGRGFTTRTILEM